jgi:hypothetical protein
MTTANEQFITKEYFDAKLNEIRMELRMVDARLNELRMELRMEIQRAQSEMFKWNMGMFAGLYAVVILGYFLK